MHGLAAATKRLRRDVMERIHIKEMPTLKLIYDEGHKAEQNVFSILEQDRQEQESKSSSKWAQTPSMPDMSPEDQSEAEPDAESNADSQSQEDANG